MSRQFTVMNHVLELPSCYYCGEIAHTLDHVPPQSIRPLLISEGVHFNLIEVDCCKECNSALGDQGLWTLTERKLYIREWLLRRYKPYLEIPHWSKKELSELRYRLRRKVEASIEIKRITRRRLQWTGYRPEHLKQSSN